MANKNIKDCVVALRCDRETKDFLEHLAESLDISVSRLIFRLIQGGAKLERDRIKRLRGLLNGGIDELQH
jgi:hypothetical protein